MLVAGVTAARLVASSLSLSTVAATTLAALMVKDRLGSRRQVGRPTRDAGDCGRVRKSSGRGLIKKREENEGKAQSKTEREGWRARVNKQ